MSYQHFAPEEAFLLSIFLFSFSHSYDRSGIVARERMRDGAAAYRGDRSY